MLRDMKMTPPQHRYSAAAALVGEERCIRPHLQIWGQVALPIWLLFSKEGHTGRISFPAVPLLQR